jgi:predicted NBD/HSP70 family sugar kinase
MFYLGIDIGKNKHVASMLNEKGKTIFKAFSFSNTTDGGEALLDKLNSFVNSTQAVEIGMERHWSLLVISLFVSCFKRLCYPCR